MKSRSEVANRQTVRIPAKIKRCKFVRHVVERTNVPLIIAAFISSKIAFVLCTRRMCCSYTL